MTHFRPSVFCILNVLVNSHKDHWSLFVVLLLFFWGGNEKRPICQGLKSSQLYLKRQVSYFIRQLYPEKTQQSSCLKTWLSRQGGFSGGRDVSSSSADPKRAIKRMRGKLRGSSWPISHSSITENGYKEVGEAICLKKHGFQYKVGPRIQL